MEKLKNLKTPARLFLSFIAGSLAALAMAPVCAFPVLFASLSVLYILTASSARPLSAFFLGWFFAFGYFAFGLYWVGNALLVDGNPYLWAWPLAVCGLPFLLAFFQAFACLLSRRFADLNKISGFLSFAAFTGFFEWARGHVFTGFPWNLYGHTWSGLLPMLQILSISDVYILTFLTILWCAAPGFIFISSANRSKKLFLSSFLAALFLFTLSFGLWRMNQPAPPDAPAAIRIVQANIPQSEKWDAQLEWDHFLKHIDLSRPGEDTQSDKPTYIIWPETALTQWIYRKPEAQKLIAETLKLYKGPAYILTGFLRYEPDTKRFFNSLVMIDKDLKITNVYDKNHLVPFGEYIPFQEWIPLEPVAKFKGFSGGGHARTFSTPENLKYSPMICYEIIFSGAVIDEANRPDFILNVTNDSWYGFSPGPWQHLAQARYRAIEEGLPVIRVADTGVSAAIDAYGRIVANSSLFSEYEKNLALPGKIPFSNNGVQWYVRFLFFALAGFFVVTGYVNRKKSSKI